MRIRFVLGSAVVVPVVEGKGTRSLYAKLAKQKYTEQTYILDGGDGFLGTVDRNEVGLCQA